MTFISDTEHQSKTRRMQLEGRGGFQGGPEVELQRQIDELNFRLTRQPNTPTPTRQSIFNMVRNGDHAHSVNTWWEAAASGTDKDKECANVYAYPKIDPITISDAAINTGTPNLTSPSNPFTAAMVGRYVQITGAGVAGATLVTTILAYVGPGAVTLAVNAGTTVAAAAARINLQKLLHRNKLNTAAANPNDALKDATHSQIGTNISDPDWVKTSGSVRLGSANVAGYPFGRFAENGTTYAALHQLFSGREPFARLNVAKANQYVKVRGKLFLAIYNNNEAVLDWVRGGLFTVGSGVDGAPSTTVSTEYVVVIETDMGFRLVSQTITVAGAPDDAAFSAGARVALAWTYFAGATVTRVYRKRAAGNVFLMEEFETGANTWTDTNLSTRIDTGSAAFPVFADSAARVPAYWASADGELDEVTVDGTPNEYWKIIEVRLPFPPTVNMAEVFDPHFIVGLTEPLATEVTDVVTNSTVNVTSAAAQFTAAMTGKAFTLTKSDGTAQVSGTFTHVSANSGTLSVAATWTENGSVLEIQDSQPRGLYYDLVGVSLNDGEWDFHPEDNSELRGQPVASTPPGSTQGGTTGQPPTDEGGRGGIDCVLDETLVKVRGTSNDDIKIKRADEVNLRDLVWNGLGHSDDDFNEIEWIRTAVVDEIAWLMTATKRLGCTHSHRVITEQGSYACGTAVRHLSRARNVLISDEVSIRLEAVSALPVEKGKFRVVSFGLRAKTGKRTGHLLVVNDIVSHNRKDVRFDPGPIVF